MSAHQIKYELLGSGFHPRQPFRHRHVYVQACLLLVLCAISSVAVFITWTVIYRHHVNVPPTPDAFPPLYANRANRLAQALHYRQQQPSSNITTTGPDVTSSSATSPAVKRYDHELVYPSRLGNFLSASSVGVVHSSSDVPPALNSAPDLRLVCYYVSGTQRTSRLPIAAIPAHLCTHLHIGMASVNGTDQLQLDAELVADLHSASTVQRAANPALRLMLWVGGGDATATAAFARMVRTHASRMRFVRSVLAALAAHRLDGIDVDWEFPSGQPGLRERVHFVQLLHELRRAYQRGRHTYLLSVAVAAPEAIAYMAYDVVEIEQYVDYANVMAYDFHAWSEWTPFTGLNAPLMARPEEKGSYLATLNIEASVRFWEQHGMNRSKIVIGLPTYGHSFKLVNPFNANIMSPASGFGDLGDLGFVTYPDVCWFKRNNYFVHDRFDAAACSPYLSAGVEWLSYEDEHSMACKAGYVVEHGYGGAMVFSLNADDWRGECAAGGGSGQVDTEATRTAGRNGTFPLVRRVHETLFGRAVPGG